MELVDGALYRDDDSGSDMSLLNLQLSINEGNAQIVYHFGQCTGKLDEADFKLGKILSGFIGGFEDESSTFLDVHFIKGKDTDVDLAYLKK